MAFSIKNDTADQLLRELTELTGESLTDAVTESLRERLDRERRRRGPAGRPTRDELAEAIRRFRTVVAAPADRIDGIEYDEHGVPT